jgi:hypothetical protein
MEVAKAIGERYLTMNDTEPLDTDVGRHEFIIVSEAQVSGSNPLTWTIKYSENCIVYNVLLVKWDEARRLA